MNTTLRILAPAVAAAFVLGGCGLAENAVEGVVEEAVEKGVEGATGADVEAGEDGFTVKTEDGEFSMGTDGSLPEGFPQAEVPMVEGTILQTAKVAEGTSDGYHVSMDAAGELGDVYADALALLEGAGYAIGGEVDMGEMKSATLEGDGAVAGVTLGVMPGSEDGKSTVSYTVAMAKQ